MPLIQLRVQLLLVSMDCRGEGYEMGLAHRVLRNDSLPGQVHERACGGAPSSSPRFISRSSRIAQPEEPVQIQAFVTE